MSVTMPGCTKPLPSWNQRHRLLQTLTDLESGIVNPHHSMLAFRLTGPADLRALERAWIRLQHRHWTLLTCFDPEGKRWWLDRRADPAGLDLVRPDTADPASPDESAADMAALKRAAEVPFDLEHGPLARLHVVRRGDHDHLAGLVAEHLVCDAWSHNVLFRDLTLLYEAETGAATAEPPSLDSDFPSYVQQQNDYLESPAGERRIQHLAGLLTAEGTGPVPALPLRGFPGEPAVRHDRIGWVSHHLPSAWYDSLLPVARSLRGTRISLVHAAFHQALAEHCAVACVSTPTVVANRHHPSQQNTVGWFADKVVVTSRPQPEAPLPEVMANFRGTMARALDASRVPWPRLIQECLPEAFGHQADVPYISFNAEPSRITVPTRPTPFGDALAERLSMPIGWHDASVGTFWSERDGLRFSASYKTDWYASTDVSALWETTVRNLAGFADRGAA